MPWVLPWAFFCLKVVFETKTQRKKRGAHRLSRAAFRWSCWTHRKPVQTNAALLSRPYYASGCSTADVQQNTREDAKGGYCCSPGSQSLVLKYTWLSA